MAENVEEDLIALVTREQRGFRRILFAGFGILFVLVAMSAALGVYYYSVSQDLKQTSENLTNTSLRLERKAFDARVVADRQTNRVANLERAVHRAAEAFRLSTTGASGVAESATVIKAVNDYVQRGRSLYVERVIDAASQNAASPGREAEAALVTGAAALLRWERDGEEIDEKAKDLPEVLLKAQAEFEKAAADKTLAPLAHTGLAWVLYLNASSTRSNFSAADCNAVFQEIAAGAVDATPGPQPLYWKAQCERKLGQTPDALRDYVLALGQSADVSVMSDDAALNLAMNAFHGVGTLLISTFDVPEENLRKELDLAGVLCGKSDEGGSASTRMALARACLNKAIGLRERLHQTPNQINGTGENVSFSYLRDSDFQRAYDNTVKVEKTGLFAWNELLRALSAHEVAANETATPEDRAAALEAEREARRNVSFFEVGRFAPCELKFLLNADLFDKASKIVADEHAGKSLACDAVQPTDKVAAPKT
jgi:hypothetical protein